MAKRLSFIVLSVIFAYFLLSVVIPILTVELTYQYRRVLHNVFAVSDIRGLILPQFRVNLASGTYTKDGISVPAIFVDEPVVYNVDPNNKTAYMAALRRGIAHAAGTSFPGSGGLGYYFAHSSTPDVVRQYNAVFYLLGKLNAGDKIYLWHDGSQVTYVVTSKRITAPDDLSFLYQNYPTETIVLQTCWPPGTTLNRMLVFAQKTP